MRTILVIAGIVLAGATVIAVVQHDKKKDTAPEIHKQGDGHDHPAGLPAASSVAPSLNPAHGVAGHRCDLPVGAPLNQAAANPAQNSPSIKMNPVPGQTSSASPGSNPTTSSGLKTNPAHGLPGHRCDLEVGAPLN